MRVSLTGCVSHIVSVILAQGEPGADGGRGEKVKPVFVSKMKNLSLVVKSVAL